MDATMPDRGQPRSLWAIWWNAILVLRPAFSRLRTFMWFVTAVAGLTVRVELLGVTSIVRALNLRPRLYTKLLDQFHSSGIKLDRLSALWAQVVLQLFPSLVWVNNRLVLVGDGIKTPKRGKKMPAVKLLHQQSESNTRAFVEKIESGIPIRARIRFKICTGAGASNEWRSRIRTICAPA